MKNAIMYNYNIVPENLQQIEDNYAFYVDYNRYFFMKVNRPQEDILKIDSLTKEHPNKFHMMIPNVSGSLFTEAENSEYVLMKVFGPEHIEIDLDDILRERIFYDKLGSSLDRTNWGHLWSEKVDYLEYQVSELATSHKIVKSSFSYYVGLAENAIEYFNLLNPNTAKVTISHRRITENMDTFHFYNPLDLVLDYQVRDIASILKVKFFMGEDVQKDIEKIIESSGLTPLEYNLLFCRLLYPSYYFDELVEVLEKNKDDEELLKYIEKTAQYEQFLRDTFHRFEKVSSMIKIDWLIEEH